MSTPRTSTPALVLSIILQVVRVVLWIAIAGCLIAAIVSPFAPAIIEWASRFGHVHVDSNLTIEGGTIAEYAGIAAFTVSLFALLFAVDRTLEILKTLRAGSPFVRQNATRLARIGWALIAAQIAQFAAFVTAHMIKASSAPAGDVDIEFSVNLTVWIVILAVFALSEVFREGARMKKEQDYTV